MASTCRARAQAAGEVGGSAGGAEHVKAFRRAADRLCNQLAGDASEGDPMAGKSPQEIDVRREAPECGARERDVDITPQAYSMRTSFSCGYTPSMRVGVALGASGS